MTPVVWVGGSCGVVTDALPGTMQGDESDCDYCSDGCTQIAAEASEYEVDDPDHDGECDLNDVDTDVKHGFTADGGFGFGPIEARGRVWGAEDEQ